MESNLDDKYYQKYIQYKNKYLMLKQLKYNNDLEGGMMFGNLFGSKEKKETKEAKPISQNLQNKITETDGDYLVFNITDINQGSYKYVVDQNLETNQVSKSDFNMDYKDLAYIITKKGTNITGKIITDDINKNIQSLLTNMKLKLNLNDDQNQKLMLCIENFNKYSEEITNIFNDQKKQIANTVINREINLVHKSFMGSSEKIKKLLTESNTILRDSFNNILQTSEYKKYNEFVLKFELPFTKPYNEKFFTDLTNNIKTQTGATVTLNMIIKIKETENQFVFEKMGDSSISHTPTYLNIKQHKIDSEKTKTTATAPATESAPATETPAESSEAK